MITVVIGSLDAQPHTAILRPVRSDMTPVTPAARDVIVGAGPDVAERLDEMGPLPVGGAVITPAGSLRASFIIHVVTSAADEPESEASLRRALRNGLRRAAEWGLESLAIPALGTGAGKLEYEDAARAMVEVVREHLEEGDPPREVTIVVRGPYEAEVFERTVAEA